ncbi:hypothetical protein BC829DRAFT_378678 [Chytridium lagenaria]|nr:hypothetical protein BC829DRAFT_378678 [Chytridium lagenaria]
MLLLSLLASFPSLFSFPPSSTPRPPPSSSFRHHPSPRLPPHPPYPLNLHLIHSLFRMKPLERHSPLRQPPQLLDPLQ